MFEEQESEVRSQKSEVSEPDDPMAAWVPEAASTAIQNPKSKIENLLDLSAPERWVALKASGQRYVHVFSPITEADWIAYDKTLRPTMRVRSDEEVESSSQALLAANELWLKKILRIEGYPEGTAVSSVPLRHREEAVKGLGYVLAAEDQPLPDTETVTIKLEALWNGVYYKELTQLFKRPLVEHELRFQEALRRSALVTRKVGGQSRRAGTAARGEIVSLPNLRTMIALYDEITVSTAGYAGSPMDALHKSCSVRALFTAGAAAEVEVPEETEDRTQESGARS